MYNPGRKFLLLVIAQLLVLIFAFHAFAQFPTPASEPPLTSQELVRLIYQLPKNPEMHDQVVDAIRRRGIGFPLTDGMRTLVAAKSGNDTMLRRTLEEAERRRVNPKTAAIPPPADANDLLERCRAATLAAAGSMPDFIVRQQIARYVSYGNTKNWKPDDTLAVAVSYRQSEGEQYKLLSVNGVPPATGGREGSTYGDKLSGATSTGEYVSRLVSLFAETSRTEFKPLDTDLLRGRPTVVYEFDVQKQFSPQILKWSQSGSSGVETMVGSHGRIWIDREKNRVLRLDVNATDIDPGFPITASNNVIDYDWVSINDNPYLLPTRSVLEMSFHAGNVAGQSRNDIRFRGYQKFGSELKIIEDDEDVPPEKPDEAKKPDKPIKP
jgi:hypothetical protein